VRCKRSSPGVEIQVIAGDEEALILEVALFGGSFNPPHIGHLLAADFVKATEPVDEIWLIPSFRHPFGKELVSFEHRLRMCELMSADTSGWLRACGVEQRLGGDGRTVDTIAHLKTEFPEHRFTLVLGSDILEDLPHWKDFAKIEQMARILIVHRAGHPSPRAAGPALAEVSSTDIRDRLQRGELPAHWIPRRVLEYARAHRLYGL